jgi:hypothetical protein
VGSSASPPATTDADKLASRLTHTVGGSSASQLSTKIYYDVMTNNGLTSFTPSQSFSFTKWFKNMAAVPVTIREVGLGGGATNAAG